jgi:hypothetical protein
MNYAEYRDTEHWKRTRAHIRRRARGWCERCKVGKRDDVHHLTYERLGAEQDGDLIGVCRECHEFLHGLQNVDPAATTYTKQEQEWIRRWQRWDIGGDPYVYCFHASYRESALEAVRKWHSALGYKSLSPAEVAQRVKRAKEQEEELEREIKKLGGRL